MISIKKHKLQINLSIPLPYKYRGGGLAVFRDNGGIQEVLLGLRANNPGKGLWSFPGGEAEGREKLSSTALREFKEEMDIQLYRRYITKVGFYKIKKAFFEWTTVLIKTDQIINLASNLTKKSYGEFIFLRWVPILNLENYKLHPWVKEVIDYYLKGNLKPYIPAKTELPKKQHATKMVNKNIATNRTIEKSGANYLFDMAEMLLTKVDPDGTKYFKPVYQAKQEAFHGI